MRDYNFNKVNDVVRYMIREHDMEHDDFDCIRDQQKELGKVKTLLDGCVVQLKAINTLVLDEPNNISAMLIKEIESYFGHKDQ